MESHKDPVAPGNLFLQALFSQVGVSLNARVISLLNNNHPFRAYIEILY